MVHVSVSDVDAATGTEQEMVRRGRHARQDLDGPSLVFSATPTLAALAGEWARRDQLGADTVIGLQEALHALELARVRQPIQVNFNFHLPTVVEPIVSTDPTPTSPDGYIAPWMTDGSYTAEHAEQLIEAIGSHADHDPS